eukprot:scaffold57812_cov63-Phaeocystis_antarctica.AAC.2
MGAAAVHRKRGSAGRSSLRLPWWQWRWRETNRAGEVRARFGGEVLRQLGPGERKEIQIICSVAFQSRGWDPGD